MSITDLEIARALTSARVEEIPPIPQTCGDATVNTAFAAGIDAAAKAIADELQFDAGFDRAYFLVRAGVGA